jgi:micrococcal nuclease
MKLKDIKTLITSGTILLAVGLYLVFNEPKEEATTTLTPATEANLSTYEAKDYVITTEYAMDKTGKELIDVKYLSSNDGDTFSVEMDGQKERVRLLMIDTPEMNYGKGEPMPYADEAKSLATRLLEQADAVQLLFDKGPETDKYDRLLAYVFVDGVSLHEILLSEGLAAVRYVNKPNDTLEKELLDIQKTAEIEKVNIWAHPNYLQRDGFHPEEVK